DGTFDVGNGTYAGGVTSPSAALPVARVGSLAVRTRVTDKDDGFTDYTASVTVAPASGQVSTPQDTPTSFDLLGLVQSQPTTWQVLTFSLAAAPDVATQLQADGHTVRLTPRTGYTGTQDIGFTVHYQAQGQAAPQTAAGTVTVTVTPNPAPVTVQSIILN